MTVTVYFEDSDSTYEVDFFKLAKKLGLDEERIKTAVYEVLAS